MKMKKKIVALVTAACITTVGSVGVTEARRIPVSKILSGKGKIEVMIGVVKDSKKNGKLLYDSITPVKEPYTYISYKYVSGVKKGTEVLTIAILDKYDEVDKRYDFIIK